jgi:Rnl2 family RNA ligase
MKHRKYDKIENHYLTSFLDNIKFTIAEDSDKITWFAQEKIHGANFSVLTNGDSFAFCSRNKIINLEKDNFYNVKSIIDNIKQDVLSIYSNITTESPYIIIYGELFGGSYPGINNVKQRSVQKGVYYSPNLQFIPFDIFLPEENTYLNFSVSLGIFKKSNVLHLNPVAKGSLEDLLNFDVETNSTIYKLFNLPKIENNIMEGIVIRPSIEYKYKESRLIIKKKSNSFLERKKESKLDKEKYKSLSHENLSLLTKINSYITENKLNNVLSHLGYNSIEPKNIGTVIKEFQNDVIEDLLKEHPELDKMEIKQIKKLSMKDLKSLVFKRIK